MGLSDCSRLLYHWAISPSHVELRKYKQLYQHGVKDIQSPLVAVCWNATWDVYSAGFWYGSVGGIMVSIAAFQAVDPGSIPGWRSFFSFHFFLYDLIFSNCQKFHSHLLLWQNSYRRFWGIQKKMLLAPSVSFWCISSLFLLLRGEFWHCRKWPQNS